MPATAVQNVTYEGVFRYAVDPNRRVQMPFRWRSQKPLEFSLIVWPQHDAGPCLRVLPPDEMEKLRAKIDNMPIDEKRAVKRHIGSSSVKFKLDSANRIGIPEEMAEAVGIRDQVVFAGMMDYFELWTPSGYADMNALEKPVVKGALRSLE